MDFKKEVSCRMIHLLQKIISAIKPKPQVFVAKGCFSPWYSSEYWRAKSHVTNIDDSIPCQATVTCKGVTNMSYMFQSCTNLTTLDLSNFDTSNVRDMSCMFCNCSRLTKLDLSNFNTSNVRDMSYMFFRCSNLVSLDVSKFNTSKVIDMYSMFEDCHNLTSLDLSNFDTSNVVFTTYAMFSECHSLTELDLSSFDTSKVINMSWMFYNCSSLTTIKGVIDMKSCEYCGNMFTNCSRLRDVKIKNPPEGFEIHACITKSQYTIVS